jgi:3-methyladenine DNA glycosylase/8-oxoguanine DNA glycosylase
MARGAAPGVLSAFRYGNGDLTTRVGPGEFWRATYTPDGPGTLHLSWRDGARLAHAWGPGAGWLLARVPAFTGELDPGHRFTAGHPAILVAQRDHDVRIGASGTPYHELLPTILGQRITAGEALRQWRDLTRALGAPAPGPADRLPTDLRLPPDPERLAQQPTWWFHPLGIEAKRAATLKEVARRAARLHEWAALPPAEAATKLALLPGVGEWTVGCVLATAFGDPDAVAVGDFHLKNVVVHALTGRARGTDAEMMELLAPYAPNRGRAVRLLLLTGHQAPKFGPRRKVLPTRKM